jgi:hypothetical protein
VVSDHDDDDDDDDDDDAMVCHRQQQRRGAAVLSPPPGGRAGGTDLLPAFGLPAVVEWQRLRACHQLRQLIQPRPLHTQIARSPG